MFLLTVVGIVVLVLVIALAITTRYKVAGPNEAFPGFFANSAASAEAFGGTIST